MTIYRLFIFCLFLCFFNPLHAQTPNDSATLETQQRDQKKKSFQDSIIHHLSGYRYEQALKMANEALEYFREAPFYYAYFQSEKGLCFDYLNQDDSALYYYNASMNYAFRTNDKHQLAKININLGSFYFSRNQLDSSTHYFINAAGHNGATENYLTSGVIHNNLGLIKWRQKDYAVSRDYFLESLAFYDLCPSSEMLDKKRMSAYINIINCYRHLDDYDNAHNFANQTVLTARKLSDTAALTEALSAKGAIFYETEDYQQSVAVSRLGYDLVPSSKSPSFYPLLYNLGVGYAALEMHDSAIYYNQIGLYHAELDSNRRVSSAFHQNLEATYVTLKDYELAYTHLMAFLENHEYDINAEKFKVIEEMEQTYRNEKKAQEIVMLKQQTEIQRLYVVLLLVILFLAGLTGYFIFRKRRIKHTLELALQKEKIAQSALMGQEDERKRISLELHDSIGASLANIVMRLSAYMESDPNLAADASLNNIHQAINDTCNELRSISHNLAPYKIEQEGLTFAVEDLISTLNQSHQTHFKSAIDIRENEIGLLTKSIIYRIVQELTANICKHAKAVSAKVNLHTEGEELIVQINDNGVGIESANEPDGIGLKNVKNRIAYLNGKLEIITEKNYGTLFSMHIPL